ncbi:MAG: CPBP family intramembrane metalloprotease [Saprospiraceae bacterium]|nr:CPBP family intramembrane metalloprotease [Saprospiraceae bacterium]
MEFTWFDHIYAFFLLVVVPVMSWQSGNEEFSSEWLPPKKHLFYSNGLMLLIGAMLVGTSWNVSGHPWKTLGVCLPHWSPMASILTIFLAGFYLVDQWIGWNQKQASKKELEELSFVVPINWEEFAHYLFLAFAAGIGEEVIFRGFLIPYLTNILPAITYISWYAIGITACSFALSHLYQGWKAVAKITILAFLLGWLFVETRSLLPVIVLHIAIDILSGITSVMMLSDSDKDTSAPT